MGSLNNRQGYPKQGRRDVEHGGETVFKSATSVITFTLSEIEVELVKNKIYLSDDPDKSGFFI